VLPIDVRLNAIVMMMAHMDGTTLRGRLLVTNLMSDGRMFSIGTRLELELR